MINLGDYVTHMGFPPAEGVVAGIQKNGTNPEKFNVGVRLSDGRLVWDDISSWVKGADDLEDENIIDLDNSEVIIK